MRQYDNTLTESYRTYKWGFWKWDLSFLWRANVLRDHLRATRMSGACVRVYLLDGWTICAKLSDDRTVDYASASYDNVIWELITNFSKEHVACGTEDHSCKCFGNLYSRRSQGPTKDVAMHVKLKWEDSVSARVYTLWYFQWAVSSLLLASNMPFPSTVFVSDPLNSNLNQRTESHVT